MKPTIEWIQSNLITDEEGGLSYIEFGKDLEELPENLRIDGELWLKGCERLKALPRGLEAYGIHLEDCPVLETIPPDLRFVDELEIINCPALASIPAVQAPSGDIVVCDCVNFTEIEDGVNVSGLDLENCVSFNKLPTRLDLSVLYIKGCPRLEYISQLVIAREHLVIEGCPRVRTLDLPDMFALSVTIRNCKRLENIYAPRLMSGELVEIIDCPSLDMLPRRIISGSDVTITGNPLRNSKNVTDIIAGGTCEIDFRARKLLVGKNLRMPEDAGVELLPDKTTVGGEIVFGDRRVSAKTTRLREARRAARLTQAELAARIGVPQQYISRWENGVLPPKAVQEKITEVLGEVFS